MNWQAFWVRKWFSCVFTGPDHIQNVTWLMLFIQSDSNAGACVFKISAVVPEDTVLSL